MVRSQKALEGQRTKLAGMAVTVVGSPNYHPKFRRREASEADIADGWVDWLGWYATTCHVFELPTMFFDRSQAGYGMRSQPT
jgi:hypothetical protein